jgi:integrase
MSVEAVQRTSGRVWRVRWRDEQGRARSKVLGRKADAELFDAEITRRKRLGQLAQLDQGKQTLGELAEEWWVAHAEVNLAPATQRNYAFMWDKHVEPRLGQYRLCDLTPQTIAAFRAELHAAGVGDAAIRKAMVILQAVLQRAVEWEWLAKNPAAAIKKPAARRLRSVEPLAPRTVEQIRQALADRGRLRDATLVSVLAYAGLRPGEALGLHWADVGAKTLRIQRAVALGRIKATKTGLGRSVTLLDPLRQDLEQLRQASRTCRPDELVFGDQNGAPWSESRWRNWRRRSFRPAASHAGLPNARPYDLRHSFVSLLIHEGRNVVEVAAQAGHAPAVCLSTYAHLFAEADGLAGQSATEAICHARAHIDARTRHTDGQR